MVLQEGVRESETPNLEVTISGIGTNSYPLRSENMTIGRSKDNDIVVSSGIVSRHHAQLEFEDGKYFLVILPDTTNIIFVNGQPGSGRILLHDRDAIRMEGKGSEPAVAMTVHLPLASIPGAPTFVQTSTSISAESELSAKPAAPGETLVEFSTALRSELPAKPAAPGETLVDSLSALQSELPAKPAAPGETLVDSLSLESELHAKPAAPGETMVESMSVLQNEGQVKPAAPGATMIESLSVLQMGGLKGPSKLVVTIAGQSPTTHILDRQRMTIGRSEDNDIVISSPLVSRQSCCDRAHSQRVRIGRFTRCHQHPDLPRARCDRAQHLATRRYFAH